MKNKKIMISIFVLIFIFLAFPILAKEYEITNYDITLKLEPSGDYLITERITEL